MFAVVYFQGMTDEKRLIRAVSFLSSWKRVLISWVHCRRNNRKKVGTYLLFTIICLFMYLKLNVTTPGTYTGNKPWSPSPRCKNSEQDLNQMVQLTYKVHAILEKMAIDCWLMYGSLWGPLRGIEGPLPWDDDVDLAINGGGQFSQTSFEEFKAIFMVLGLSVENRLWQSSLIVISEGAQWPSLDLFVFYNYNGMMRRRGIESWLIPFNYRLYHTFPTDLVEQPLPKVKFGFFNISVPRNGIEIMKHLYPYNWWKVVRPIGCDNYQTT